MSLYFRVRVWPQVAPPVTQFAGHSTVRPTSRPSQFAPEHGRNHGLGTYRKGSHHVAAAVAGICRDDTSVTTRM
jgi:hypothetical protein